MTRPRADDRPSAATGPDGLGTAAGGQPQLPQIQLLVVQPTPFCNIDCRYCYLPDRADKSVVAEATLRNLFTQVFESGWAAGGLAVVWHAGEPTVLPAGWYRRAFALIDELHPADLKVTHSFQTNGTLIDDDWCRFFAEEGINVGVSIDGPKHLHDKNRVTRAGRGTWDKAVAGMRRLRAHGVPFHVISVLSPESLASPQEMFDFYIAEGVEHVCFNVEESEGTHVSESFATKGIDRLYYDFLSEFWRLSAGVPGRINFIREIDDATRQVLRPAEAGFFNQLTEPFAVTSMDWRGNIATFSPELLGLKNAEYDDFIIGNVNRETLAEMAQRPLLARMLTDIRAGVALCRERCEYFSVCGGGEPVNKLFENGGFASAETTYCRMTKMRATDLVLDRLERVKPENALAAS
jgi:uncharacterized protein